ncbi:24408_t:CDS:2 [Dentiscutata erythropus]|uniref:24408_t:CDS:1 n=1 Tax=Dentiscutata erythropus TaxID=1348616 RepID=A0A9N9IUI5_9GLOM|nr:24408_t:CDS:2 [Dentiscutata erythropus]
MATTTFFTMNSVQIFNEKQGILDNVDNVDNVEFLLENNSNNDDNRCDYGDEKYDISKNDDNNRVLKVDDLDAEGVYGLFCAADEFMLDDLIDHIPDNIGKDMDFWQDQDCIPVINTIFGIDSYKKLRRHLVRKINSNPQWLLAIEDLSSIEEYILIGLLSQKNLTFDHITRWDLIIKWSLCRNPSLDKVKVKKWSDDEFGLLGLSVRNLIPLIEFTEISRNDIHAKILPYEKILPHDIDDSALKWYLTKYRYKQKSYQGLKNSNLINHVHALYFKKWIGDLSTKQIDSKEKVPYKYRFELIFRSSRDGFENYSEKCNQVGPTLCVAKIAGQRCLIGGFVTHGLHTEKKTTYVPDGINVRENFLFFFDNREHATKPIKLCRMTRYDVLYRHFLSEDGPCFGDLRLILRYNTGVYLPSFYTPYFSKMYFDIEECEIFKIVKTKKSPNDTCHRCHKPINGDT